MGPCAGRVNADFVRGVRRDRLSLPAKEQLPVKFFAFIRFHGAPC